MKTVMRLSKVGHDQAYGLNISEHITNELHAIVDLAQVYVVLKRLEQKRGYLSKRTMPAPSGSGHEVIVYTVTPAGADAMATAGAFYQHLRREEDESRADEPQRIRRRGARRA
jgi:DNA-binding PadR family transcriptional regulator